MSHYAPLLNNNIPIPKPHPFAGPLIYGLQCTLCQEKLNPGYRNIDPNRENLIPDMNPTEVLSHVSIFLCDFCLYTGLFFATAIFICFSIYFVIYIEHIVPF
jgi:hypothetical protein